MVATTRHREYDRRAESKYIITDYLPGGSVYSVQPGSTGRLGYGERKTFDDLPDPTYFKRKRNGEVILHPMVLTRDQRDSVDSNWYFGNHPQWGARRIVGSAACEVSLPPEGDGWDAIDDNLGNVKDLVLVKAYAKMKSPDLLLGVTLKEREKTLQMLRKPFHNSLELSKKMFSRKLSLMKRGLTAVQASAQAWLEYRFGWRPLVYEIAGVAKAASHVRPAAGALLVARSGHEMKFKDFYSGTVQWVGGTYVDRRGLWERTAQVSAGVIYTLNDVSEDEWKRHCVGLTLPHAPISLWDATPFSFVADYYFAVGAWLQAITPNPMFEVKGNWVTVKDRQRNFCEIEKAIINVGTAPATIFTQHGGSYLERIESVSRDVNLSLPQTPPRIAIPLSFSKIVDQAALIVSGISGNLGRLRY